MSSLVPIRFQAFDVDAMAQAEGRVVVMFGKPTLCGNGVLDAGEECDDGNIVDEDTCSSACETMPFFSVQSSVLIAHGFNGFDGTSVSGLNIGAQPRWVHTPRATNISGRTERC